MKPLTRATLRGNWATLLLPITDHDRIDFALLGDEVDAFAAARVDGVYSNGSAGEFHTQTEAEFDRVSEVLAARCGKAGLPFQIGACHMSAQLSRERLRRTKALQPSGFQIILPDWFVPSWEEILAFVEGMVTEADPVPVILYNPPHAKRQLTPAEWDKLTAAIPGIVGIKVPGGDEGWYRAMAPVAARVSVFIPGHTFATGLVQGARGAYSNVACLSPAGAQRWADLCAHDLVAGLAAEERIKRFWFAQIAPLISKHQLSNMAADKAAAAAGGWLPGMTARLRWPYRSADTDQIRAIAAAARAEVPEFFA